MVKLDIIPSTIRAYDCLQGNIVAASKYKGYNYQMMFLGSWAFNYTYEKDKFIGDRIQLKYHKDQLDCLDYLDMYHGIKVIWEEKNINIIDNIRAELVEKRPVLLTISTFSCPWNLAYQKYDMIHCCLVIGIDDENRNIFCIDPYMTENIVSLKWEEIINCNYGTFIFNEKDYNFNCYLDGLKDVLSNIENRNTFKKIMFLSDDIKYNALLQKELTSCNDVYVIPIIKQLKRVGASRFSFSETLSFISNEFDEIALDIIKSGEIWNKIRLLLVKMSIVPRNKKYMDSISQYFDQIIEIESKSLEKLNSKLH